MKVPKGDIFFNKNKFCKSIYLDEIEKFIREKLSEENLKVLEGELGLKDQIFMLYWNNRFSTSLPEEKVLEQVNNCIDAYKFLLDSNLDPVRIRHAFMKALMDVISLGSGTYFLLWDSWYNDYWRIKKHRRGAGWDALAPKRHKYWKIFRFTFKKISEIIEKRYHLIPASIKRRESFDSTLFRRYPAEEDKYSFAQQLLIAFSYPLFLLKSKKKINITEFEKEFFYKHKWCLERMCSCNKIFLNKYREEICREISYDLGLDPDPSYFRWGYFQNNPIPLSKNSDFLFKVTEAIVSCFSNYELELFRAMDSEENIWNLRDQIEDRYYSKYPSFAPLQEIEECIKRKGSEYRSLLEEKNAEVIREVLLDDIEQVAFVSKPTHLWNLEMMDNLKNGKISANQEISKSIDLILSLLPKEAIELLYISVHGKKYSLREQLLARWQRAWFASNLKEFQNYLNTMQIHTPYSISNLRNQRAISQIDLQAFLEKIDMFFLYPNRGRLIKKIFCRLDTGRSLGVLEKFRANVSYKLDTDPIWSFCSILLLAFTILLFICFMIIYFLSR